MSRTVSLLFAVLFCLLAPIANAQDKPNIVLVFLDNFGWGEPGFNGGGIVRGATTPRMDQLANEGLRLTNFNVEVQCTPSRSALMTGRYAIRSGNGTVPLGEGVYGLVQWEVTMAEMLSDVGYATGMFGKWHLGRTEGRFPTDQGFDEWYGIPNSTDESVYSSLPDFVKSGLSESWVMEGKKGSMPEKVRPYRLDYRPLIDRDLTDRAIDFMQRQAKVDKPFFVYLPYTATHFPTMPHPNFVGKSGKGPWGDLLMQIDSYLGELMDTIDELNLTEETLFIFTADNGPEGLSAGETSMTVETSINGSSGPWRSTLFTGYEGALRVPFAVRWPGKIEAGRVIDGIDMSSFMLGKNERSGRDGFIVYMGNDIFGVKWRDWKLHFKEQTGWNGVLREYTMPRLYNLINDPQESDNVLFPHTWVPKAALPQLEEHVSSLKAHPPIRPGTPDPYEPPN